jgi:hypothetical protein
MGQTVPFGDVLEAIDNLSLGTRDVNGYRAAPCG